MQSPTRASSLIMTSPLPPQCSAGHRPARSCSDCMALLSPEASASPINGTSDYCSVRSDLPGGDERAAAAAARWQRWTAALGSRGTAAAVINRLSVASSSNCKPLPAGTVCMPTALLPSAAADASSTQGPLHTDGETRLLAAQPGFRGHIIICRRHKEISGAGWRELTLLAAERCCTRQL